MKNKQDLTLTKFFGSTGAGFGMGLGFGSYVPSIPSKRMILSNALKSGGVIGGLGIMTGYTLDRTLGFFSKSPKNEIEQLPKKSPAIGFE